MRNLLIGTIVLAGNCGAAIAQQHTAHAITPETIQWGPAPPVLDPRPKEYFPRLDIITVYAIAIERITGKEQFLPPLSEQWPAVDRSKTPNARPS